MRACVVCGKRCEWHGRYDGEEFQDGRERWACSREHAWEALLRFGTDDVHQRVLALVDTTRSGVLA